MTIDDEIDEAFKQTVIFESCGFLSGFLLVLWGILKDDQTMITIGTAPSIIFFFLLFYAFSIRLTESQNRQE